MATDHMWNENGSTWVEIQLVCVSLVFQIDSAKDQPQIGEPGKYILEDL